MNAITAIGYDVVVSLVDGHSSNVKFYKNGLCGDKPTSFIPYPLDQHRFLYLLFYTSSQMYLQQFSKKCFISECTNFEELTISPNFR